MASPDQTIPASPVRTSILLVDDQRFVGLALARLIDGEPGFELHCCERGSEAVATAERLRPDVILQDLLLPDADGLTLVRTFRQHPVISRTPVIVLSGNDDETTRARALAAGADDYLVKLPSKAALLACLRHQHAAAVSASAPAVAPSTDAVLDPEVVASYRDEGAADPDEALRMLVDVFLQDADGLVAALRTGLRAGDGSAARTAHALKGCALAIGASALAGLCAGVEHDGGASGEAAMPAIEAALDRVKAACAQISAGGLTAGPRSNVRAAG